MRWVKSLFFWGTIIKYFLFRYKFQVDIISISSSCKMGRDFCQDRQPDSKMDSVFSIEVPLKCFIPYVVN